MAGGGVRLDVPISSQSGGKQLSALAGRLEPPEPEVRGLQRGQEGLGARGQRQPPLRPAPALAHCVPAKRWSRAGSFCSPAPAASEHGSPLEGVPLSSPHSMLDSGALAGISLLQRLGVLGVGSLPPLLLCIFWCRRRAEAVLHPRQGWRFSPARTVIAAAGPFSWSVPLCNYRFYPFVSGHALCFNSSTDIIA